ncbi:MAG: hypothetical protein R2851_09660 [Caldilineaceae bacterium]
MLRRPIRPWYIARPSAILPWYLATLSLLKWGASTNEIAWVMPSSSIWPMTSSIRRPVAQQRRRMCEDAGNNRLNFSLTAATCCA